VIDAITAGGSAVEEGPAVVAQNRRDGGVRVFISYRRDDAPDATDRLSAELRRQLGAGNVFLDIDNIDIGARFPQVVEEWVQRCDVLLAVIGPDWLSATDEAGNRRLEDPDDYVRLEIEAALRREIRVVPVLMHGAGVPKRDELPATLSPLVEYNAIELTRRHWDFDVGELVDALVRIAGNAPRVEPPPQVAEPRVEPPTQVAEPRAKRGRHLSRFQFAAALAALAALAAILAVVLSASGGGPTIKPIKPEFGIPSGIALGGDSAWLIGPGDIAQVNARTGAQVAEPFADQHLPEAVAVGAGAVWVANWDATLTRISLASGLAMTSTPILGKGSIAIAVGGGDVWVLNQLSGTVTRLSARNGAPIGGAIDLKAADPSSIAYGDGQVWVVASSGIIRIAAATGRLLASTPDTLAPTAVAYANGTFWVLNATSPDLTSNDASVARYRPDGAALGPPVSVPSLSLGLVVGSGSVWVTNSIENSLTRIDAATGAPSGKPIQLGAEPDAIAAGAGVVWVTLGNGTIDVIEP
jgi:hypothetical protein